MGEGKSASEHLQLHPSPSPLSILLLSPGMSIVQPQLETLSVQSSDSLKYNLGPVGSFGVVFTIIWHLWSQVGYL